MLHSEYTNILNTYGASTINIPESALNMLQCKVHTVWIRNTVQCAHCAVQILRGEQAYTVQ
jgi:hypothetical protein